MRDRQSGACVFAGSSEDEAIPMLVAGLKGLKVIDVACGSGDAQTLAVTDNGAWNSWPGHAPDGEGRFPEGGSITGLVEARP